MKLKLLETQKHPKAQNILISQVSCAGAGDRISTSAAARTMRGSLSPFLLNTETHGGNCEEKL